MVIEYTGPRPPRNPNANAPPPDWLVTKMSDLLVSCLAAQNNNACSPVQIEPNAQAELDEFDRVADQKINAAHSDVEMQLWNRAHLKALKLAGLLAVGVNPHQPIVTQDIAKWSMRFVERDVETMSTRFSKGDVGQGDSKLINDLKRVLERYFTIPTKTLSSYGIEQKVRDDKVIPYLYLSRTTLSLSSFRNDKRGATEALKKSIQTLVETGQLNEVPQQQVSERYKTRAKMYVLSSSFKT